MSQGFSGGLSPAFLAPQTSDAPTWFDAIQPSFSPTTTSGPNDFGGSTKSGHFYTTDSYGATLTFREDKSFNETDMFSALFTVISSIQYQALTSTSILEPNTTLLLGGTTTAYPNLASNQSINSNASNATSTQMGHFQSGFMIIIGVLLSVVTGGMNVMVMVSFKIDKQLQTISNWFLFSLAVADALIGFISIPFMTLYTIQGEWTLGYTTCQFWLSMDYLMSNASVYNLLLISFDRYFSVTRPLSYRPRRTMKKALIMIASTYIISLILWPPWIISWPYIEGKFVVEKNECMVQFLKTNPFVTVGTILAAFYLPVAIMILLYARVFYETEKRQRELSKLQAFQQRSVHTKSKVKTATTPSTPNAVSRQGSTMVSNDGRNSLKQTSSSSTGKSGGLSRSPSTRKRGLRHFFSLLGSASSGYGSARRNARRTSGMSHGADEEDSDFDEMDSKIDSLHTAPEESVSATYDGTQPPSLRGSKRGVKDNIPLIQMKSPGHQGILGVIEEQRQTQISKRLKNEETHKGLADMFRNPRKSVHSIEFQVADALRSRAASTTSGGSIVHHHSSNATDGHPVRNMAGANGGTLVTTIAQTEALPSSPEHSVPSVCNNGGSKKIVRNSDKREVEYTVMIKLSPGSETAPSNPGFHGDAPTVTMQKRDSLVELSQVIPEETDSLIASEKNAIDPNVSLNPQAKVSVSHERSVSEPQPMTSSCTDTALDSHAMSNSAIVSNPVTPPALSRATSAPTAHKPLLAPKVKSIHHQASKSRRMKKRSEKKQESKAAKTLSAILAAFVLTWLPYSIFVCIEAVKSGTVPAGLWTFSYYLCYINSTVNPLCYALCNPNFRATYIRILTCKWTKRQWNSGAAASSGYRGR